MVPVTDRASDADQFEPEHYGREIVRAVELLREAGREARCSDLTERLVVALGGGVRMLDEVPRDNPRRPGTNGVVTLHKLHRHAVQRLEAAPADHAARWVLVAIDLACGANDGGLSWMGPLIAADPTVVDDAIAIANVVENLIGLDASEALREACAAGG